MSVYRNILEDPTKRESYMFGDKPFGTYWEEVPETSVPTAPAVVEKLSLADVEETLKQANIPIKKAPKEAVSIFEETTLPPVT